MTDLTKCYGYTDTCFNAESPSIKFHPQLINLNAILTSNNMCIVALTVVHMTCPHLLSFKKIGVHLWKVVVTSMLPLRIFLNSDSVGYFHSIISYWSFKNWSQALAENSGNFKTNTCPKWNGDSREGHTKQLVEKLRLSSFLWSSKKCLCFVLSVLAIEMRCKFNVIFFILLYLKLYFCSMLNILTFSK